jgi:hypothetical protein
LNESRRPILSDVPSLHVPLLRHPRVSRRARSGGMSRIALVTARQQADNDKTRVSSIDKRRVTPVPEEGAASTEASCCWARPSGPEGSWMAPLEVWTRRSQFGLRDLAVALLAEGLGRPLMHGWGCVFWLPSERSGLPSSRLVVEGSLVRRPSKLPAEPIQAVRFPADQSRLRAFGRGDLPAHHRQGSPRCVHRTQSDPGSPRPLTSCLYFFWHAARRCDPRRPPSPLYACAPFRESPSTPEGEDERSTTRARGLGPP